MITCCELVGVLIDFVAEELPTERRQQIEQHLQCCSTCRIFVETYQITVRLCRRLPCSSPPAELMQRLRSALNAQGDEQPSAPR